MRIEFVGQDASASAGTAIAVLAYDDRRLSEAATALDAQVGGGLGRAVAQSRFTGAKGQTLDLIAPSGSEAARVVLVGVGPEDKLADLGVEVVTC